LPYRASNHPARGTDVAPIIRRARSRVDRQTTPALEAEEENDMTLHQHTLTRRLHRGVARIATVTLALLLLAAGCNEEGVFRPSPVLGFSLVSSSATEAEIGQSIVVDWEYTEASQLRAQTVKLIRLSMAGLVTVEDELPRTQRSTSFAFNGPVTVVITATDRRGRQIDAAFDVRLSSDYHFRMQGVVASHPGYPRLGQQQLMVDRTVRPPRVVLSPAPFDIEFTHFFGVYEVPANDANGQPTVEDGRIDDVPAALRQALPARDDFFGHSFGVEEAQRFGVRFGSAFPLLDAGFLATPEGAQFLGVRTRADVIAFAGKVAYDGRSRRDRKSGLRYRRNVFTFEPIFATIDLRSDAAGLLHVADVDLGNGNMGLVLSAYHGFTTGRFVGTTSVSYDGVEFYGDSGELTGEIKGSRIGFNVTTAAGAILTTSFGGVDVPGVYADIDTISWHLPLLPDTDLSGLN
jgi:hypothetical protein